MKIAPNMKLRVNICFLSVSFSAIYFNAESGYPLRVNFNINTNSLLLELFRYAKVLRLYKTVNYNDCIC